MLGLERCFTNLAGFLRKLRKRKNPKYSKSICHLCNQICYNEKDLRIHTIKEH